MEEGRVITYESRNLKEHAQIYSAYDLEMPFVLYALKMATLPIRKEIPSTDKSQYFDVFLQATKLKCAAGKMDNLPK